MRRRLRRQQPRSPQGPPLLRRLGPARLPPVDLLVLVGLTLLCLTVGASYLLVRRLTRPLGRLATAADAFAAGDHTARAGIPTHDELGAVGRAFDHMADTTTQLLRSHEEMMANVAHELRTPWRVCS